MEHAQDFPLDFFVGERLNALRPITLKTRLSQCDRGSGGSETHGYGGKYHPRTGEEVLVVEVLPDGVFASFVICIQGDLVTNDLLHGSAEHWRDRRQTSVSNQNLYGNWRKILVYIPCR